MYCGQCGRELKESMLFCPYCGKPVSVPDREDDYASPAVMDFDDDGSLFDAEEKLVFPKTEPVSAPNPKPERVVSLFEAFDMEDEELSSEEEFLSEEEFSSDEAFEPLEFDFAAVNAVTEPVEEAQPAEAAVTEPVKEEQTAENSRLRRENTVIQAPESAKARAKKTYIPVQNVDPENIFMDEPEEIDEYDAYDEEPSYSGGFDDEDDYEFEDREEGGFFRRHIRGIVGLLLLLVLLVICFIWASTTRGQTVLAGMNLAWKAEVYADLGYEAYAHNNDLQAARYYENAYSRDKGNYNYAHSAMVAYYEADQLDKATTMLKICVELQPNNPEPYAEFLRLYHDEATRPWEITEIIRQGYQRTGDSRLNIG